LSAFWLVTPTVLLWEYKMAAKNG